uniref:Uncharacterized protein n=1 Tax=Romanomermis culicivorax TaxID=13658 RepID=A0A915K3C1_ROMCU
MRNTVPIDPKSIMTVRKLAPPIEGLNEKYTPTLFISAVSLRIIFASSSSSFVANGAGPSGIVPPLFRLCRGETTFLAPKPFIWCKFLIMDFLQPPVLTTA